jgi:hypothetical protein
VHRTCIVYVNCLLLLYKNELEHDKGNLRCAKTMVEKAYHKLVPI